MKKIVIAGSVSLPEAIECWTSYWNNQDGYTVINFPRQITQDNFLEEYPRVHREFFVSLNDADVVFVANEEKKGIQGYIGAEVFAEIVYALALRLVDGKNIDILLAYMPSDRVQAYEEIQLWLQLGWIRLHKAEVHV